MRRRTQKVRTRKPRAKSPARPRRVTASKSTAQTAQQPRPAGQATNLLTEIHLGRPLRVVVVDDEPYITELTEMLLREWIKDLTLLTFTASSEAWKELSQRDPDLLLTDDIMPGLDGHGICQRLLSRGATYPIIVRSALAATEGWVRELAHQGLNVTYLPLPHELEIFKTFVEHTLRKKPGT